MTVPHRLRVMLAVLGTALVVVGLWAIPVASAADTATVPGNSGACVTVTYNDGTAQNVSIPAGDPVTVPELITLASQDPKLLNEPANEIAGVSGCSAATTTSSSTSTTTSSSTTSSSTSTTTPGSTATTTTTTTTSTPTTGTSTTGTTTTTHTSTTPTTTKTTTGPGKPRKQPSSSSTTPGKQPSTGKTKTKRRGSSKPKPKHHKKKTKTKTTKQKSSTTKSGNTHKKSSTTKTTTPTTPASSVQLPTAPPTGVPNFFINSFQIPPFLLPIYQAAGIQYEVPWQVLAAINEIETDYGRNLSVSSAGAVGWMQFMPATWKQWGIDANGDGVADPYNPVDAIFSAARYLHAAGASTNLSKSIFAYNHADWYVQSVLLRAKLIAGVPQQLIGALTGLVEGHFPVAAAAQYSDNSVVSLAKHRVTGSNAAITVDSNPATKGTSIFAKQGSPVVAVNDGKIVKIGYSATLGHYIELQDATGNVYTYSQLGSISSTYPVPKPVSITAGNAAGELGSVSGKKPSGAASAGTQPKLLRDVVRGTEARLVLTAESKRALPADLGTAASTSSVPAPKTAASAGAQPGAAGGSETSSETATQTTAAPLVKERLFAHPARAASYAAGGMQQLHTVSDTITSFKNYFADTLHLAKSQYTLQPLRVGSIVIAGTILGRLGGPSQGATSHLYFQIQPAGHGAPDIDPKPILDGWKLLQATAVYRANGVNPFYGAAGGTKSQSPTVGQVLLMSKQQLEQRVLSDPNVQIYACGRRDIEAGKIDRRVLATIEYLSTSGLHPDVTGLACDASVNGTTGVDQAGSTGESVDISEINGVPIAGHTGSGSVTDEAIRRLLALQGSMAPAQIIGPISYRDQPTTLALPSHDNRIQILFGSTYGSGGAASKQTQPVLKPGQWTTLINRLSQIPEPVVAVAPSRYAIRQPTH